MHASWFKVISEENQVGELSPIYVERIKQREQSVFSS